MAGVDDEDSIEEFSAQAADPAFGESVGPRRVTSADVARAVGVSRTTVSFVLNDRPGQSIPEETRRRVQEAGADVVLPTETDSLADYQREVGRLQAEHLIAGGHRRIGYATPGLALAEPIANERLRGVRQACAAAGLVPPVVLTVDLEADSAARAVAGWRQEGVSAVCAYSDEVAVAVLAGLREQGLAAPGDLAVVGVEDMPTARLAGPPLTTVAFDSHALGRELADAVLAALEGRGYGLAADTRHFRLIPRSST